jgi:transposase
MLDTPKRQELVSFVISSSEARQMPYIEIPIALDWDISEYTIRRALIKEGYSRRVARVKPFLTATNRQQRRDWCEARKDWKKEDWAKVLWTDESTMLAGTGRKIWITRRPGEELLLDCLVLKFKRGSGWMVWACFSGMAGLGPLVFWEKDWGMVTSASYCERIVPIIEGWLRMRPGHIYMEDNAPPHAARATRAEFEFRGIHPMDWPPKSPDLNPIETLWNYIKECLHNRRPRCTRLEDLRAAIKEIWESIPQTKIDKLMEEMEERVRACLRAEGGHIPF